MPRTSVLPGAMNWWLGSLPGITLKPWVCGVGTFTAARGPVNGCSTPLTSLQVSRCGRKSRLGPRTKATSQGEVQDAIDDWSDDSGQELTLFLLTLLLLVEADDVLGGAGIALHGFELGSVVGTEKASLVKGGVGASDTCDQGRQGGGDEEGDDLHDRGVMGNCEIVG